MNGLFENQNGELPSGYKLVSALPSDFTVNGDKPTSDSWVQLEKGQVVAYSLKFGDYTVTKYKDSDVVCAKGDVQENEETRAMRLAGEAADSYVKSALTKYASLPAEDAKTVAQMTTDSLTKPENLSTAGWIHFNVESSTVSVVDYSLKFGDYVADYSSLTDGNYVSSITTGNERNKPHIVALGSEVCLTETDCFKVIEINGTTATLLANNNIDTSTGMQGSDGSSYSVKFSRTNYWMDTTTTPNTLKSAYSNNGAYTFDSTNNKFVQGTTQVYPDIYDSENYSGNPGTNTYSVAYYVNQYVENLKDLGINVTSGRILKRSEVEFGGIAYSYRNSGEYYWLGSAGNSNYVYYWRDLINSDFYTINLGVRPVIYIRTSEI